MAKDSGTVNIHGKEYTTVAKRVQDFREAHALKYSIETELVERTAEDVVMKAIIKDETGRVIGTGYAEEKRSASQINRTSALENCETSAIGRALAAIGLAGTEYASADEVAQAITHQTPATYAKPQTVLKGEASEKQRQTISDNLLRLGVTLEDQKGYLIENWGVKLPLSKQDASMIIEDLFEGNSYQRKEADDIRQLSHAV